MAIASLIKIIPQTQFQMKLSLGYDFNQTGQYCSHNYTLYTTTTMSDVGKFTFVLSSHDLDICKVVILV